MSATATRPSDYTIYDNVYHNLKDGEGVISWTSCKCDPAVPVYLPAPSNTGEIILWMALAFIAGWLLGLHLRSLMGQRKR